MPTAMLSILQMYAPQTQMRARHLLATCGHRRTGVGVLEAAMIFNALGISALAVSRTLSSVPTPSAQFRRIWGYPDYARSDFLRKQQLEPKHLRLLMKKGAKIIVCTGEATNSHAHLLTGYTKHFFIYHESRTNRFSRSGVHIPQSIPHSIVREDELQMGWHDHEYHTLIISGNSNNVTNKIMASEQSLAAAYRHATERALSELGLRPQTPRLCA